MPQMFETVARGAQRIYQKLSGASLCSTLSSFSGPYLLYHFDFDLNYYIICIPEVGPDSRPGSAFDDRQIFGEIQGYTCFPVAYSIRTKSILYFWRS